MRGEILTVDTAGGLIAGADGNRYRFEPTDYRRDAPRPGIAVDFVADGETARDIYPLTSSILAGVANQSAAASTGGGPWATTAQPYGYSTASATADAAATSTFGAGAASGMSQTSYATVPAPPRDRNLFSWFFRAATDNYAKFHGRARRKEYWSFALWYVVFVFLFTGITIIGAVLSHFGSTIAAVSISPLFILGDTLLVCFMLGMVVPSLSVAVRRLHDIGRSGWWLLLHCVPVIGNITLFVMSVLDGEPGPNRFGPPEK